MYAYSIRVFFECKQICDHVCVQDLRDLQLWICIREYTQTGLYKYFGEYVY